MCGGTTVLPAVLKGRKASNYKLYRTHTSDVAAFALIKKIQSPSPAPLPHSCFVDLVLVCTVGGLTFPHCHNQWGKGFTEENVTGELRHSHCSGGWKPVQSGHAASSEREQSKVDVQSFGHPTGVPPG